MLPSSKPLTMIPLPIDALLPEILTSLGHTPNVVLEAAPGAGKTTRVPAALLSLFPGQILVLEPRRIAARLAARRSAEELGEAVGETVGYQVRFEDVSSPRTRLRFVTEGILTRRLLSDPSLQGVDAVVLDEFHERHLETDLALALLKRLQQRRPQLRILVMSATLESGPVAAFLKAPTLRSEGRAFPLTVRHLPHADSPLHTEVAAALALLLGEGHTGNTLVFLPGAAEIHRATRACEPLARSHGLLILPLHGALSPAEQDRVLTPSPQPKLILATNVAESSVTVPGVTAVIDSGLARQATWSTWTGLPTLSITRISQASATQRAGRAGRTAPGQVLRLYPRQDLNQRPPHDAPEILRADLSQLCLTLRVLDQPPPTWPGTSPQAARPTLTEGSPAIHRPGAPGLTSDTWVSGDPAPLAWLDSPPPAALTQAEVLLDSLGAVGETAVRLARYPLSPRLARVLLASLDRGIGKSGCRAVALLSASSRLQTGDLLTLLDAPPDPTTAQSLKQLLRLARPAQQSAYADDTLLQSLLTAFPDRVARRRAGRDVVLSNGLAAELAGEPPNYDLLLALDAEDRPDKPLPLIRVWCRVEPDWLLDFFPERLHESTTLTWNRLTERVEAVSTLRYDQLTLEESTNHRPDPEAAADLLVARALETGLARFVDTAALENLEARLAFASLPPLNWSASSEPRSGVLDTRETSVGMNRPPELQSAYEILRQLAAGLRSFTELESAAKHLLRLLERVHLSLQELAPASLKLATGRTTKVHYEANKPPWIASRLQDFFGMTETPRIGPRREPVVVHLLAPNQRPIQTTTDLAGFWQRLYPQVRKELSRRYPRHPWPERP